MTVEQKLLEGHKERIDGLTSFTMFLMCDVCKMDIDRVIAYNASRKIVEDWLAQELKEEKNDGESKESK